MNLAAEDAPAVSRQDIAGFAAILVMGAALVLSLADWEPVPAFLMLLAIVLMSVTFALPATELAFGDTRYVVLLALFAACYAIAPLHDAWPQRLVIVVPLVTLMAIHPRLRRLWYWIAGGVIVASHALQVIDTGTQRSDIGIFIAVGVDRLVHLQPPYPPIGLPHVGPVTYPPGALFLLAPFQLVSGDMRWALVLGEVVAIVLMRVLLGRLSRGAPVAPWREALVLLPLTFPRAAEYFFLAENHEWVLAALLAGILLLLASGHSAWAAVVVGIGAVTKQYFLVFPGMFLVAFLRPRDLALAAAVVVAVVAPFLVQDYRDTAHVLLSSSTQLGDFPQAGRIEAWAILRHAGFQIGWTVANILTAVGVAITLAFAFLTRRRRDLASWLIAAGAAFGWFVFLAPYSAYNYYMFAVLLLCWGLALRHLGTSGPERHNLGRDFPQPDPAAA